MHGRERSEFGKYGIVFRQFARNRRPAITEQGQKLEAVHDRLPLKVIIEDNDRFVGFWESFLDPWQPFLQLGGAVEIVIALIAVSILPEPVLVIPAVKAVIGERCGHHVSWPNRSSYYRLVDIHPADLFTPQQGNEVRILP